MSGIAAELLDLVGGQVGAVGHPDGAVLERVHGQLVLDRLGVDPQFSQVGLWSPPTGGVWA